MESLAEKTLTIEQVLRAADQAHRETSGSGGCAAFDCDDDNHAPAWHGRFVARLRELLDG